jgi:hypothetical protein
VDIVRSTTVFVPQIRAVGASDWPMKIIQSCTVWKISAKDCVSNRAAKHNAACEMGIRTISREFENGL